MKKPTKAKLRQRSAENIAYAREMREEYLNEQLDITLTPSGIGYEVHESGTGVPTVAGKKVEVHYVGMLLDRPEVFEETFGNARGARFVLGKGEVIAGWEEAIALLRVGDVASLIVPAKHGYGPKGRGQGIPPNSELYFYVEIVSVG